MKPTMAKRFQYTGNLVPNWIEMEFLMKCAREFAKTVFTLTGNFGITAKVLN
jgi:predicted ATP-grasp superfamily ATP-dependent carboligase